MKQKPKPESPDLFAGAAKKISKETAPLAERMRPRTLEEILGQEHLLAPGKALRRAMEQDQIGSMLFWGPPGSGKTTLARLIALLTRAHFVAFSAVLSGVKEIREVMKEAEEQQKYFNKKTILFVDEIHRFNKAQQDAFLHHVEEGKIVLIGATTENPSFEIISALLSRCQVFTLNPLTAEHIEIILKRALADAERGLGKLKLEVEAKALGHIADKANGDARVALNALELAATAAPLEAEGHKKISLALAEDALQKRALLYDKAGEEHFNLISALHKSLRGSDPDAALYWLARMLAGGEDPLYIARRMVRFASEDIGNADPLALTVTLAAKDAYHFLGTPEGELALAQACLYLATAPKSNAAYIAFGKARREVEESPAEPVPPHIRNAPTSLMRDLGYGQDYKYPHEYEGHFVAEEYLPEKLQGKIFYRPSDQGLEAKIKERLEKWRGLKKK
jgi:putative ATPase